MCDELDDVFADEPKVPAQALETWNRRQEAWKPFKRWKELDFEERSQVWYIYDTEKEAACQNQN